MSSIHVGHSTYYLDVTYLSYNQAGNYSTWNIHIHLQADSGWSGYASGIGWACYANGGSFSFNGTSVEVANYNVNLGHDGNGYMSTTITASIGNTGTSTYGGGGNWGQGISGPRIPKVPGAPGISVASVVGNSVALTVTAPGDNGGTGITQYTTQYSLNGGAWTGNHNGGSTTYTGLAPGNYVFRAYATNAVGNGPATGTGTITVNSGGKIKDGGVMKPLTYKIKDGGVMKPLNLKIKDGGVMKPLV